MANEHERVEVCRLCGKQFQNCFPIFQDEDNILEKINTCLPIDISPDDKLPSNVCKCCSYRLSISYELRCTAVEVDKRLRMQLQQKQSDVIVYTNKDTNNFSENFLNIKRQIIDEENVLHYQNDTQEIRDKINIHNDWKIKRENVDEICYEKKAVISTEDNETAASVNLVAEIDIVEMKYEDVMEASIEQTDNNSDFVKNKIVNDCQTFSEHKTLEQIEQSFYCHTCKIKFEKERYFKAHMNIHEEITVNCTTCCSAKCSSMYDLFFHKRKKHNMFKKIKQLKYACTKCDRFFAHTSTWENHSKNKCPNMTDKCCKYCKVKFTTRTKLILHLKEHQNIHLEHKCNRCDAVFKEKLDLAEHIREIHNLQLPNKLNIKEKYVCKFCGKKFNSCRLWKNHERIHTGETLSSKCHKSFRSDQSKSHHVQREHKKKEYVCEQCVKCFSSYKSKWQHAHREHIKKKYVCDQCEKCFSVKKYLHAHISTHLPVEARKYQCDICQKKFLYNCHLTVHKRIHSDERSNRENFFCDYCGKCFSVKKYLRAHISTHLPVEARKYQCDICRKKFLYNCYLTVHKRIHSEVRPYKCDVCSFTFKHLKSMKRHRKLHFKKEDEHARNILSKKI